MRKHTLLWVILGMSLSAYAQQIDNNSSKEKYGANLDQWTEEQITQWEDSVRNALFPPAKLEQFSGSMKIENNKIESNPLLSSFGFSNTYVSNSYSIDKTKAVGEIPISSVTTPSGAIGYFVPIDIYPGINGFQPELKASYNSMAGDGIMGFGWNIGGLSTITRTRRSLYYDGNSQGVDMTTADAFTLDGARLIKLSETTSQIKYETEQGFIKVTAWLSGSIVKYFEVFYPEGKKAVYGSTANSINYLEYPITQMSDLYGNAINYVYSTYNNHSIISYISYNNGAKVEFQYTSRAYPMLNYSGGVKVTENQLLQSIVCKLGSVALRTYEFTYQLQKNSYVISQIGCTASGKSLNPLRFFYGEGNNTSYLGNRETQLWEWYSGVLPNQLKASKGKFDYGTDDDGLIILPDNYTYWQHYRSSGVFQHSQNQFKNYYTGTEKILLYTGLNSSLASPMPNLLTENGFIDIFCTNLDGKYDDEVVKVNNYVSGSADYLTFKVYSGNVITGLSLRYTRAFSFSTVLTDSDGGKSIHPKFYFTGDFNGDGKDEVLAVSCHNPFGWTENTTRCYLFDLDSNVKLYDGYVFPYVVNFYGTQQSNAQDAKNRTDKLFVLDYDGDGKSEICLINDLGVNIYKFVISGSTYTLQKVSTYTGLKKTDLNNKDVFIGEFNNDGIMDLLVTSVNNNTDTGWAIYNGMGNGQFEKSTFTLTSYTATDGFMLQDMNGDGLIDLMKYSQFGFNVYLANNNKFSSWDGAYSFDYTGSKLIPTNINSNNYFSQLVALKNGKVTSYSYPRNDTKEKLLTGMVTSLGVVNKNYYSMLNSNSGHYTKGYGATYPNTNFQGPFYVPVCVQKYTNGQLSEDNTLEYYNAVIHKQGLGFRGFETITNYDNIRGRTSVYSYDPFNFGILKSTESSFAKTTNNYSVSVLSSKLLRINLSSKSVLDKLKNNTTAFTYVYDEYGNPKTETINYGGGISETVTRIYSNTTTESGYFIGFPTDVTKTINRNGVTWSERTLISSREHYNPLVFIKYQNGNQVLNEVNSYDTKGNIVKKLSKRFSSTVALEAKYEYDSFGRKIKRTDPLGLNTMYEYNASNGTLTTEKNHKGQATIFGYDEFGRLISKANPDGTNESTSHSWDTGGTNSIYCIKNTGSGTPITKMFHDALNREVRRSITHFDGIDRNLDKLYDSYGRLLKVSLPFYYSASSTPWTEYGYDNYDRAISVNEASGGRTTYSYSGNSITSTKNGIATTKNHDTQGNVTSVSDPAGTITYNLRPDKQPNTIVAPGNITTSFGYDVYGRRISITDPSAGAQSNQYDPAGNINRETDARNNVTTMTYDNYNRLLTKSGPEFSTTFGYNTDGLLTSKTSTNGTSTVYTYDSFGRLSTNKESATDGKWLQKTMTYSGKNVSSIGYSSQNGTIVTENYIYTNGNLSEVKLNNQTSIWKVDTENSMGVPTIATLGSTSRTYLYDARGYTTRRSGSGGQFLEYSFDAATGNLTYRKDKSIQENFVYDNLARLTGYKSSTASYDTKGNILSKTDVGTFSYNLSNKPYAVSGVTTTTNAVPKRSQTITYYSFKRPNTITEGNYSASFIYNSDAARVKMEMKKNGSSELRRYYLSNQYELDEGVAGNKERLYIGGDYYSAPAVYIKEGTGSWQIYYILRDYQGSITHITNSSGTLLQELGYDAWGRLRNPSTQIVYDPGNEPTPLLGRGYTGHEHLTNFGLINMNARLYDPAVGRFLSPDPYVQSPDFSQNFNRYSYCLNNPLKYTDQSGEIFGLVTGFFKGVFTWKNPLKTAWEGLRNEYTIFYGILRSDSHSVWRQLGNILSRLTWESPQTVVGLNYALFSNYAGQVDEVGHWGGATVLSGNNWGQRAVTIGNYIFGNESMKADPNHSTFQHEYGHYLQSRHMGPGYLVSVGIPSILSTGSGHSDRPYEQDANRRAFLYFNENVEGFYKSMDDYNNNATWGWDFVLNSFNVDTGRGNNYVDYKNPSDLQLLSTLTYSSNWLSQISLFIDYRAAIIMGINNK